MSTKYVGLKVAQLRQLCTDNGMSITGLRKAELIAALVEFEANGSEVVISVNGTENAHDVGGDISSVGEDAAAISLEPLSTDSQEIIALKLKLQLAKIELNLRQTPVASTPVAQNSAMSIERELKGLLPKMSVSDDEIISFFNAFERTLELYGADQSSYARLLPGCLSAKASKVYSKLSFEQSKCYDTVKREILSSFKLDANSYLAKFHSAKRFGSETYKFFANRLQELQSYYLESKHIESFEALKADNLLEQFLTTLPNEVKAFVLARRPSSISEASDFADLAFQVSTDRSRGTAYRDLKANHKQASDESSKPGSLEGSLSVPTAIQQAEVKNSGSTNVKCYNCKGPHKKMHCPKLQEKTGDTGNFKVVTCFSCGERNHKTGSPVCKKAQVNGNSAKDSYFVHNKHSCINRANVFVVPVYVNGRECSALRDTGAFLSMANVRTLGDIIKPLDDERVTIKTVSGKSVVPVADIQLYSPLFNFERAVTVRVGLTDDLAYTICYWVTIFFISNPSEQM